MNEIFTYFPVLFQGLMLTLFLMILSLSLGFLLASLMTILSKLEPIFCRRLINSVIFFICGTPLLVQLYLIYYGSGQFAWLRHSFLWFIFHNSIACTVMALSLNSACYTTVLLRGAINSVPRGQVQAGKALGFSPWLSFRRIIAPQALRLVLPAYSNEVLMILKSTSLASTITILELTGVTQEIISETYQPMRWYVVTALFYLVLGLVVLMIFRKIEHLLRVG